MMQGQMLKDLPLDAISNIQSFLIGKPDDLRLKNNKKLVELQRLFKINYKPFKIITFERSIYASYMIKGKMLNINILLNQKERLNELWKFGYNYLWKNETFKSTVSPYGYILRSNIEINALSTNDICYESEEFIIPEEPNYKVDNLLIYAKIDIENQMKENNETKLKFILLTIKYIF